MDNKCIYCGKGQADGIELNKSHIIPDALTNYTGDLNTNNNVCSIEHNSKFADNFESEIINGFAQLRNILGIKNKQGDLPQYKAKVKIDGIEYTKTIRSKKDFFQMRCISSGIKDDTQYKIGKLEDLEKIKRLNPQKVKQIDLNECEVSIDVTPDISMFTSHSMFRLVAKITFEWYCKQNSVKDKLEEFEAIIRFIEGGGDTSAIEVIDDDLFYQAIHTRVQPGSHLIGYYLDNDKTLCGLVSLYGLVVYKIKLGQIEWERLEVGIIDMVEVRSDGSIDSFPMACISIVGGTHVNISALKVDNPQVVQLVGKIVKKYYVEVINTQLMSPRGLYSTVKEVGYIINSIEDHNLIHDYLIGYQDERLIITTYTLYKIATSAYDMQVSFADNLETILGGNNTQTARINTKDITRFLKQKFFKGELLKSIEEGIKIFDQVYQQEILKQ